MKMITTSILATMAFVDSAIADIAVTNVTAQQRYSRNGNVDIVISFTGESNEVASAECIFVATNSATQIALSVTTINEIEECSGSGTIWTRHFVWDAAADVGAIKIDNVALTINVAPSLGGVQLWQNGPYWAECNVGATNPEDYGYYFWWGDTVGYKYDYEWVSVKDYSSFEFYDSNCSTYGNGNQALQSRGYIDSTYNLVAEYDAATQHLGAPWRMPTDEEFSALLSNCDTTWTTKNGVYGKLITGRGAYASKSIFLPAAGFGEYGDLYDDTSCGYYWSATPSSSHSYYACYLVFGSNDIVCDDDCGYRYDGQSVRPLRDSASCSISVSETISLAIDLTTIPNIPDLGEHPTIDEITNVFNNAEDQKLALKITNATEYVAFREWAGKVMTYGSNEPIGAAGVLASSNAWLSFALGSETLIENAPTNGQMKVVSFEPNTNATTSAGLFDFTVGIEGILVGEDADTNNLAQVFGIEGGTSLKEMSSANINVTFGTPVDGKVKFTAGPKDVTTDKFFMKVKLTP